MSPAPETFWQVVDELERFARLVGPFAVGVKFHIHARLAARVARCGVPYEPSYLAEILRAISLGAA